MSLKNSEKEDDIQTYRSSYTAKYCSPNNKCWPNATVWQVFGNTLSEGAILTEQFSNDYRTCERQGSDARKILNSGDGICMQYHNCKYEFCEVSQGTWNIPEYTLRVSSHYRPPFHKGSVMKKKRGSVMRLSRHNRPLSRHNRPLFLFHNLPLVQGGR